MQAKKCQPTSTAYNVGCVITDYNSSSPTVLAEGFSRELPGNTHAEQCALVKLGSDYHGKLSLYSTMEPCSERLSGNLPCVNRILEDGRVARVVIAIREPKTFVECKGVDKLRDRGIEVAFGEDEALQKECLRAATIGHSS